MINELLQSIAYILLGFIVFFIGKLIKDVITPFNDDTELTTNDNPALGLSVLGYYVGVIIVYMGATLGPDLTPGAFKTDSEFWIAVAKQLGVTAVWTIIGIVALNVARVLLDKFNLKNFSIEKEIIRDRNMGAGAIECGSYIASALIIAASIHGDTGGILTAVVFFILGQIALMLCTRLYQFLTPFDINKEIEKDNVAAGIALAGNFIGMGLVVAAAASQPFTGWLESIGNFSLIAFIGVVILVFSRFAADKVLLPGSSLNKEIAEDKNVGAALVEFSATVSFAVIVFALV